MASAHKLRSYVDCVDRKRFPEARFEPVSKQPGSKILVLGKWVEVTGNG